MDKESAGSILATDPIDAFTNLNLIMARKGVTCECGIYSALQSQFRGIFWWRNFCCSFDEPFAGFTLVINGPLLTLSVGTEKYPHSQVTLTGSYARGSSWKLFTIYGLRRVYQNVFFYRFRNHDAPGAANIHFVAWIHVRRRLASGKENNRLWSFTFIGLRCSDHLRSSRVTPTRSSRQMTSLLGREGT